MIQIRFILYKAVETSDVGAYPVIGALLGALAGCNFGALNIEILFFFQTIFLMFKKIKLF